jgi:hypothetical protein
MAFLYSYAHEAYCPFKEASIFFLLNEPHSEIKINNCILVKIKLFSGCHAELVRQQYFRNKSAYHGFGGAGFESDVFIIAGLLPG